MRKFVITSSNQLVSTLQNNPALYDIPVFSGLRSIVSQSNTSIKKGCNCGIKNKTVSNMPQLKSQLDSVLKAMNDSDFLSMKKVLNLDQICYYRTQPDGKLTITCL